MGMFALRRALASQARMSTGVANVPRLGAALCGFLLVWVPVSWGARDSGSASFSIDLDKPYADVLAIVSDVAHSGTIKGTFEYRGEDSLDKAEFQESSRLFPAWTEPGKVFYKIRSKALSPSHFLNSNDVGTVAVRYVVQERGPNSTRLFIDAVFIESARHHGHPSDGYVETCEFGEIGKRLKERDQLLAAEFVKVKADRAELKALPYMHARVVEALTRGQEVTVLAKSAYWYQVRAEDGKEGWISHSWLEGQP